LKVYIAAPYSNRQGAIDLAAHLENLGQIITHKWWDNEGEYDGIDPQFALKCAQNDYSGVVQADCFILLNSSLSEGKATELGIAIALDVPIYAVGEPSRNIFHYWPTVRWVRDTYDLIETLEAYF
jgi:nucleoside 2-deoxyribosyltransferase